MQKVMGLGQPTSQERQNKESYPILDDFHVDLPWGDGGNCLA
jgi:hypothetical protein